MTRFGPEKLVSGQPQWPATLSARLGEAAPAELHTLGNLRLLARPKTALFCSARCPGDAILRAQEQAVRWAQADRCVISGFHSPVEQDCLRILLRDGAPVIVCPARGLPRRIPAGWQSALAAGRLLLLTGFPPTQVRVSGRWARRRNEWVAALADEAWFAHVRPGGSTGQLLSLLAAWKVPCISSEPKGTTEWPGSRT